MFPCFMGGASTRRSQLQSRGCSRAPVQQASGGASPCAPAGVPAEEWGGGGVWWRVTGRE